MAYSNFLIIQTAFIGDAILASSLVEKLHTRFPEASISILVRKGNESIYADHPFLKEVLVWDKTQQKLRNLLNTLFLIRNRKYDCVINCHRYASSGFLTGFSGAKHKAGYKQTPFAYLFDTTVKHVIGNGTHETERYDQLVRDFTDEEVFKPRLYPGQGHIDQVAKYKTEPYICMAPASVWFTKQLPAEKWAELCSHFKTMRIYFLGSAADKELCNKIRSTRGQNNIEELAGNLGLLSSCALMKDARMNFVNDSAPMHLCSSVNAPVTVFFCSTVPQLGFGPLSQNSIIKEVTGLDCRPCGLHGYMKCPKGHFKCGKEMDISGIKR